MSQRALHEVIGRAILDDNFRLTLFADPDAALSGYELADDEFIALKKVDAESLEGCSRDIGQRVRLQLLSVQTGDALLREAHT